MDRNILGRVRMAGCMAVLWLLPVMVSAQVMPGAKDTGSYFPLLRGKNVGVVANNASVAGSVNIVDLMLGHGLKVIRIFSPEHGFRLTGDAGQAMAGETDPATGIPVVSLYGSRKKPVPADLRSLDYMVYDLQDVGVRFYTYISTLSYVMEACAENHLPLILLDRPNPNGFYIDGPVLEKEYASFVGMHPVPVVYGMTIGEYARMVNGEGWLRNRVTCGLEVIRLKNYTHDTRCELPEKPSPNLPGINAVYLYPSLCFFEGTIVSVGRGTPFPFEVFGHPGMKSGTFSFTPGPIPGASLHPPLEGKPCHGTDLRGFLVNNPGKQGQIELSWLLQAFHELGTDPDFFSPYFNKLAGNATLQLQIRLGKSEKKSGIAGTPDFVNSKKSERNTCCTDLRNGLQSNFRYFAISLFFFPG